MTRKKAVLSLMNLNRRMGELNQMARQYNILSQDLNRNLRSLRALSKNRSQHPNPHVEAFLRKQEKQFHASAVATHNRMRKLLNKYAKVQKRLSILQKKSVTNLARNFSK